MSEINEIEQQEKYPFAAVIIIYGLLGGFVGGGIVALFSIATAFFEGSFSSLRENLIVIPFIIGTGAMLGFIPSIFAGIWLALIKFTVTKKIDYFKVAAIGYFSTVFCLGTYTIIKRVLNNIPIDNIFELLNFNLDSSTLYIGLVGALSAIILGWLVLPKKRESSENKIKQQEKYPVALVIMIYGLLGSALNSLIFNLYIFVKYVPVGNFLTIAGAVYAFIPAVLAGIWLAAIKFTVTKKSDYFEVAMIGYFSSLFYFFITNIIKGNFTGFNFIFSPTLFIGALSAMILGWFVLPKQRELSEK